MTQESPLVKELLQHTPEESLLDEARQLLHESDKAYQKLLTQEASNLFDEHAVKKICLKYRLRFLDISYFKNTLPQAALDRIANLENTYGIPLKNLKVIAPGELFNLENREKDPILVAELAKGVYLFIHKWGNEFNRFRAFKMWGMKNIPNMILSVGVIALLINFIIGYMTLELKMTIDLFLLGWLALWIGCTGFAAIMSISKSIFPTSLIWRSKFLD